MKNGMSAIMNIPGQVDSHGRSTAIADHRSRAAMTTMLAVTDDGTDHIAQRITTRKEVSHIANLMCQIIQDR